MPEADLSLFVNGETRSAPPACTLDELLRRLGLEGRRIAVAVNREVIARGRFGEHRLASGDRIEILEAVGGG